jgi:mannose-6-phosphate isomerase-like protein (cupin superfamily)
MSNDNDSADGQCEFLAKYRYALAGYIKHLGWKPEEGGKRWTVKAIHPEGKDVFRKRGAIFIDGPEDSDGYFPRLCVIMRGQEMPVHRHAKRKETFGIIRGSVRMTGDVLAFLGPGKMMEPEIMQAHGFVADGGEDVWYIGVCHRDHKADVEWLATDHHIASAVPSVMTTTTTFSSHGVDRIDLDDLPAVPQLEGLAMDAEELQRRLKEMRETAQRQ